MYIYLVCCEFAYTFKTKYTVMSDAVYIKHRRMINHIENFSVLKFVFAKKVK